MAEAESQSEIREPLLPEPEPVRPESGNPIHRIAVDVPVEPVDLEAASESTRAAVQAEASNEELGVESLDYDPVFSVVHAKSSRAKQHRRVYGYTGLTLAKWSVTICIGLLVGLVACLVDSSQEFIVSRKKAFVERTAGRSLILSFLGFSSISVLLVLVSSCLVLFWAPPAAGGGVTLVMAYLNGNDIPDFFRFSTLLTKIIGTICSISSGLLVGQEAPMVHIGAAIASFLTWMPLKSPIKGLAKAFHFDFHNDRDRREFITAGAAAGLAAAFGAPIGGVLYSLEEASSFWSKKVMWRSLLCCTCATMLLALINQWEYSTSLPGTMAFRHLRPWFAVRDLPFFIVTSVFAGIIGAFVNIAHGWVDRLRPAANRKCARILEAAFVTVLTITVIYGLPLALGKCLPIPDSELPDAKMDEKYWVTYTCSKGEYNDLATLFFSLPRKNMRQLYDMQKAQTDYPTANLGIHAASVLVLFIIAYGTATPGGIFMPAMLAGASFGAFMGRIFEFIFPGENIQPGLHAVVGTTAMLGGVFRASISLVVIMVEATGGIDFILPIITAIVVSNWVAHHICHTGAYEADLERLGGVYFLQGEPPHQLVALTAVDIMSYNSVFCFNEVVSVAEVVEVLRNTKHNGFPVLRQDRQGSKFVGLILRHQILLLLEQGFFAEMDSLHPSRHLKFSLYEKHLPEEMQILEQAMQVYHHQHYPHRRYLSSRPQALQDIGVEDTIARMSSEASSQEGTGQQPKKILALDLRPFMNRAPLTVRRECSAQRVYTIFRTLGLRHLCVTDSHNRVVGIITRKDIAMAQKQGFMKKSLQQWDSDTRSFMEAEKEANKNKNKIYHLP